MRAPSIATSRRTSADLPVQERLWFFGGYQYLRDHDSQPGTDPAHPRTFEHDKVFGKLTWGLTPRLQLMQSFHVCPESTQSAPTIAMPYDTITRPHVSVPAITFGHLTHNLSANTLWDVRVGRFAFPRRTSRTQPIPRFRVGSICATGVTSGAPPQIHRLDSSFAPPRRRRSITTDPAGSVPITSGSLAARLRKGSTMLSIAASPPVCRKHRHQRMAAGGRRESSFQRRRCLDHRLGICERRHHDRGPCDDQCRSAVRS